MTVWPTAGASVAMAFRDLIVGILPSAAASRQGLRAGGPGGVALHEEL